MKYSLHLLKHCPVLFNGSLLPVVWLQCAIGRGALFIYLIHPVMVWSPKPIAYTLIQSSREKRPLITIIIY